MQSNRNNKEKESDIWMHLKKSQLTSKKKKWIIEEKGIDGQNNIIKRICKLL